MKSFLVYYMNFYDKFNEMNSIIFEKIKIINVVTTNICRCNAYHSLFVKSEIFDDLYEVIIILFFFIPTLIVYRFEFSRSNWTRLMKREL